MCEPGQPCPEAGNDNNPNDTFLGRIEMIIVAAELHNEHNLKVPPLATKLIDFMGPVLMESLREGLKLQPVQVAALMIKHRNKLHAEAGVPLKGAHALEQLVEALGEVLDAAKVNTTNA
jgi:hypothetical protein